jgi:hypothetical protein
MARRYLRHRSARSDPRSISFAAAPRLPSICWAAVLSERRSITRSYLQLIGPADHAEMAVEGLVAIIAASRRECR